MEAANKPTRWAVACLPMFAYSILPLDDIRTLLFLFASRPKPDISIFDLISYG